jgi:GWxTD domain-containing protein
MPCRNAAVAVALTLVLASSASAALSPKYGEWRNGPVQWIMTEEEKKAWKSVKSDEEAVKFIDLFWVRRDPTPGTSANEYRNEHLTRVQFADERYGEGRKRGSLTDRGRALVVLGFPTNAVANLAESALQTTAAAEGYDATSAGAQGAKDTWVYDRNYALQFGLPRLDVVFIQDAGTKRVTRDLTKRDYPAAEPRAIKAAIVNPDLKELPEWAPFGGLEPKINVTVPGSEIQLAPAAAAVVTTEIKPAGAMLPVGASRLSLLRDVYDIDTETKVDPFTTMGTAESFKSQEDLGWAAQYCAGTDDEPTLKFILRLTGKAGNEVIDRVAPEDELVPDRVKALPGCYMLRGAIPLGDMSPGTYQLEVTIEDPARAGASHKLSKEFRIE